MSSRPTQSESNSVIAGLPRSKEELLPCYESRPTSTYHKAIDMIQRSDEIEPQDWHKSLEEISLVIMGKGWP